MDTIHFRVAHQFQQRFYASGTFDAVVQQQDALFRRKVFEWDGFACWCEQNGCDGVVWRSESHDFVGQHGFSLDKIAVDVGEIVGMFLPFPGNICFVGQLDENILVDGISFVEAALKQGKWESGCLIDAVFMDVP